MKIIDRYVLREYLIPLGYILASFCILYVLLDLCSNFYDFMEAHASPGGIVLYYFYYLFAVNGFVPFIVVVMPIALLLAALYTLTQFARHNELTAMCASGVSIRRLMVPFIAVGIVASAGSALILETLGPKATRWTADYRRNVLDPEKPERDVVNNFVYYSGVSRQHWVIRKLNKRDAGQLTGVKVTRERQDGTLAEEIIAASAEYLDGRWWFHGMQRREYDALGDPVGALTPPTDKPVEMADFNETPADFMSELMDVDFLSTRDLFRYLEEHPTMSGAGRARREVDIHARIAMPWSCVVMILLSLPATAGGVRRPAMRSVMFGLGALFAFYFFLNLGIIAGKRELLWPWLAGWLPNLVFLGIGAALTWRLR